MNIRAKQLGLKDTRFGNPHGLPHKDTRSTAFDICNLCIICLGIPLYRKIVSTKMYRASIKTTENLEREVVW
jgi:D-alanyl-D-alanine carboxypeptidase (penicillin-binding protein 5/6)